MQDFLSSFTGTGAGAGMGGTIAFATMSPFGTAPIDLFAFGKLICELVLVVSLLGLFVAYAVSMFSKEPFGEKIFPVLKQIVVMAVMTVAVGTMLAVILVFSYALSLAAIWVSGGSGYFFTAWVTLSPLLATIACWFFWKRAFKAPNPFTLKGAAAWAKATPAGLAAVGGAAGGSFGSRLGRASAQAGRQLGQRAGSAAREKVLGRKEGTRRYGTTGNERRKGGMTAGDSTQVSAGQRRALRKGTLSDQDIMTARKEARAQIRREGRSGAFRGMASSASSGVSKMSHGSLRAIGLDSDSRMRHRQQMALEGRTGLGRATSWLNHSVTSAGVSAREVGQRASSMMTVDGLKQTAASAGHAMSSSSQSLHGRVMANAGSEASAAKAYTRMAAQTAAIAGATLVGGVGGGAVMAGAVSSANARQRGQTRRAERARRENERVDQLLQKQIQEAAATPKKTKAPKSAEPVTERAQVEEAQRAAARTRERLQSARQRKTPAQADQTR